MKRPYPPAWSIIPQALVRKERWPGGHKGTATPLVSPGQDVVPDQPILSLHNTGQSLAVAAGLPRPPAQPRPPALSSTQPSTPPSQEILPAGLYGRVIEITDRGGIVIESHATLVQGVIGVGNQIAGILILWHPDHLKNHQTIPPGAILVVPDPLDFLFLRQAVASGVVGIIASSIALRDLEGFLHVDLIEFLQEERTEQRMLLQQHFPPLTLLFTEGLTHSHNPDHNRNRRGSGLSLPSLPTTPPKMSTNLVNTLSRYDGEIALLAGETSFRNGTVPELTISHPPKSSKSPSPAIQPNTLLIPGALVRAYGGELQGITGTIDYLFVHAQRFPSGLRARAARLRLEDGSFCVVPLFSLERIG